MSTKINFSPRFIRAKASFKFNNDNFDVGEQLINVMGVPAFKWDKFEPIEVIGKKCEVTVTILSKNSFSFQCSAFFTCEETQNGRDLGLAFLTSPEDEKKLEAVIGAEGILPDFVRKFPRIVFSEQCGIMPSRAILRQQIGNELVEISSDLIDISPSGIQVSTEDMRTSLVGPGEVYRVALQPRGNFAAPVFLTGEVKRITHQISPISGNAQRNLSMRISNMQPDQKKLFTDLLRQIVTAFS